jgi:hypothetical protein
MDELGRSPVVKKNFVSYSAYKQQAHRGNINVVRQGKGEGNYALIEFESIPPKYKKQILRKYKNPERTALVNPLIELLKTDYEAVAFFTNYRYPNGSTIPTERVDNISLWSNNAAYLNAIAELWKRHTVARRKLGKKPQIHTFFNNATKMLKKDECQKALPHNLPTTYKHLREKFVQYTEVKYACLIKDLVGQTNALKIDDKLLYLLAYIAGLPTRPYNTKVIEVYEQFMLGNYELYDNKTGEVFEPANYLDENGEIITFTESAVWYRLNQPGVQIKLDKQRLGHKDFNDLHRPHHHRHAPEYSFSKISMDDRDLVWKDSTTKKRVKAYYAYDVTSGVRIGSAYSMDKNEELFLDCMRDMFVFCERNGFGVPMEVEVENHLVNAFFGDLKRMFPYLRVCAPGNSQEKRAEHFNRAVKYQVEKNNRPGIGRWWLKSKYNRVPLDRVDDGFKEQMKPADQLIISDIQDTIEYNNALHSNQKRYPGKTRMEVLRENLNPNLPTLDKSFLYKYIGYETNTSIVRNMYVGVQYAKYILPSPRVLEQLQANNRDVVAYYVPEEDGNIPEVYLYQNGEYICTAEKLITYNEAQAERGDADHLAKLKQDKYIAMFDAYVKGEDFAKLTVEPISKQPLPETVEVMPEKTRELEPVLANIDYGSKALDDFFN